MHKTDFLIVGAGIVGLTLARNLSEAFPRSKITLIDKEKDIFKHASGRNSGVLHAGFYYSEDSLKAKFTREGNEFWRDYCKTMRLPINQCGKVVVAQKEEDLPTLEKLLERGKKAGVELHKIDEKGLTELEPKVKTYKYALWSPNTATVDPIKVGISLAKELEKSRRVSFLWGTKYISRNGKEVLTSYGKITYGMLFNCAGLYADKVAKDFGAGNRYVLIPFKGLYLKEKGNSVGIKRNIYPVPDINKPFLGVHFTIDVEGNVKIGPTATPAFWREHYDGLENFSLGEFISTAKWLSYLITRADFRSLAIEEMKKYRKDYMLAMAWRMLREPIPNVKNKFHWSKPGIRPQLIDRQTKSLVMDFVVERGDSDSVHILNAVSPAFTASYPFTKWVVENYT